MRRYLEMSAFRAFVGILARISERWRVCIYPYACMMQVCARGRVGG